MFRCRVHADNHRREQAVHQFAVRQISEQRGNEQEVKHPGRGKPLPRLFKRIGPRKREETSNIRIAGDLSRQEGCAQSFKAEAGEGHEEEQGQQDDIQLIVGLLHRSYQEATDAG